MPTQSNSAGNPWSRPQETTGGMQAGLARGCRPQEAAAPRGVRPLVEVGGVPVDAERRDVEGDVAGGMGAVHQHRDSARPATGRDLRDGQDERALRQRCGRRARGACGSRAPRRWPPPGPRVEIGIGNAHRPHAGPALARHEGGRVGDPPYAWSVITISSPGASGERAQHRVDPVVALSTKTRSSRRAPTNSATIPAACRSRSGSPVVAPIRDRRARGSGRAKAGARSRRGSPAGRRGPGGAAPPPSRG